MTAECFLSMPSPSTGQSDSETLLEMVWLWDQLQDSTLLKSGLKDAAQDPKSLCAAPWSQKAEVKVDPEASLRPWCRCGPSGRKGQLTSGWELSAKEKQAKL